MANAGQEERKRQRRRMRTISQSEDVPTISSTEVVSIISVTDEGVPTISQKDVPTISQKDVPTISQREDVPTVSQREDVPTVSQEDVPNISLGEDVPNISLGEDVPANSLTYEDVPNISQEGVPNIRQEEDVSNVIQADEDQQHTSRTDEELGDVIEVEQGVNQVRNRRRSRSLPAINQMEDVPTISQAESAPADLGETVGASNISQAEGVSNISETDEDASNVIQVGEYQPHTTQTDEELGAVGGEVEQGVGTVVERVQPGLCSRPHAGNLPAFTFTPSTYTNFYETILERHLIQKETIQQPPLKEIAESTLRTSMRVTLDEGRAELIQRIGGDISLVKLMYTEVSDDYRLIILTDSEDGMRQISSHLNGLSIKDRCLVGFIKKQSNIRKWTIAREKVKRAYEEPREFEADQDRRVKMIQLDLGRDMYSTCSTLRLPDRNILPPLHIIPRSQVPRKFPTTTYEDLQDVTKPTATIVKLEYLMEDERAILRFSRVGFIAEARRDDGIPYNCIITSAGAHGLLPTAISGSNVLRLRRFWTTMTVSDRVERKDIYCEQVCDKVTLQHLGRYVLNYEEGIDLVAVPIGIDQWLFAGNPCPVSTIPKSSLVTDAIPLRRVFRKSCNLTAKRIIEGQRYHRAEIVTGNLVDTHALYRVYRREDDKMFHLPMMAVTAQGRPFAKEKDRGSVVFDKELCSDDSLLVCGMIQNALSYKIVYEKNNKLKTKKINVTLLTPIHEPLEQLKSAGFVLTSCKPLSK